MLFVIYKFYKEPQNFTNFKYSGFDMIKKSIFIIVSILIIVLIIDFFVKESRRKAYLRSGMKEIDKFSGVQFEEFLSAYYTEIGYKVKMTPASNDYGADLILYKNKECIVVQAKRYSSKVGISAIQEVIGAQKYYKADKSIVITNNYFTNQAENLARSCNVDIIDRGKLIDMMSKVNGKEKAQNVLNVTRDKIICDKCGAEMVKRNGRYGAFLGYSNYPKYRNTIKLDKK